MKTKKKSSRLNSEQQLNLFNFKRFAQLEGFTETLSKTGNFNSGTPIFYKRATADKFLVFSIPYPEDQHQFYADFWIVKTESKNNFLVRKVDATNLKDIHVGFTMEHIELYNNFVSSM